VLLGGEPEHRREHDEPRSELDQDSRQASHVFSESAMSFDGLPCDNCIRVHTVTGQLSALRYISNMADAVQSAPLARRTLARSERRRDDDWIGVSALVASMLALPLAQSSWHGPEVSSVLAVGAIAMLAGHRWSISVIVLAELLLVP